MMFQPEFAFGTFRTCHLAPTNVRYRVKADMT
jgi:hypothetical protein